MCDVGYILDLSVRELGPIYATDALDRHASDVCSASSLIAPNPRGGA